MMGDLKVRIPDGFLTRIECLIGQGGISVSDYVRAKLLEGLLRDEALYPQRPALYPERPVLDPASQNGSLYPQRPALYPEKPVLDRARDLPSCAPDSKHLLKTKDKSKEAAPPKAGGAPRAPAKPKSEPGATKWYVEHYPEGDLDLKTSYNIRILFGKIWRERKGISWKPGNLNKECLIAKDIGVLATELHGTHRQVIETFLDLRDPKVDALLLANDHPLHMFPMARGRVTRALRPICAWPKEPPPKPSRPRHGPLQAGLNGLLAVDAWDQILAAAKEELDSDAFKTWFVPAVGAGFDGTTLIVRTENGAQRQFLVANYSEEIGEWAGGVREGMDVAFEVREARE